VATSNPEPVGSPVILATLSSTLAIWSDLVRGVAGGAGTAAERVGGSLARPRQETPPCTCCEQAPVDRAAPQPTLRLGVAYGVSVRPGPPCAGAVSWEDRRSAWSDEGSSA
jgi:hypothetical protein